MDGKRDHGEALRGLRARDDDQQRSCAHCGATAQIAELRVFSRAPGTVVRCPSCGSVVIVLVEIRGVTRMMVDDFWSATLTRSVPRWTLAVSPARIVLVVPSDCSRGKIHELGRRERRVEAPGVANELGLLAEQAKA